MGYFHCKMWIWAILILITCENVTKFTRCRVYSFTDLGYKTCIGIFCVGLFCGQVCESKHHTTIPAPLLYNILHTVYYWKLLCANLTQKNIDISMQGGTHATIVDVVDHVSSKKDKLQLNFIKHSPSPNLKVEMTYVWIRWSSMKAM